MNKPRRIRIYKLSTFDTFTDEERALNEAYKKAGIKEKSILKKIRDNKIASYDGIRKIDRKRLYTYEYDKDAQLLLFAKENRNDWFRVLCDNGTLTMVQFLKSHYWEIGKYEK